MTNASSHEPLRRVAVATLGCKLNQFESEAILTQFRAAGYETTEDAAAADVCVVNTCAVTAAAERKGRALIRSVHRRNPRATLLAVGCMAERDPRTTAEIAGVRAVMGNREKEHILDFLGVSAAGGGASIHVGETARETRFAVGATVGGLLGRTRGFLKVQDGCSQRCTYCIIPRLRGRGRSLSIAQVVEQARDLADQGFAEVVITGVALGTYGRDLGIENALVELLQALETVSGLRRIRLSSVEPWAVTDELIRVIAESPVICPHLHVALQSGDDDVLRRMNRRYSARHVMRVLDSAFRRRTDWGFGSDIIAGFPGESREHFENTRRLLADSPLAYLHVFPFSTRPETPAAAMPVQVTDREKKERVAELRAVDHDLRRRFRFAHMGKRVPVLFESRYEGKLLAGHAANYLDVFADVPESLAGEIREVEITGIHPAGVMGEVVNPT